MSWASKYRLRDGLCLGLFFLAPILGACSNAYTNYGDETTTQYLIDRTQNDLDAFNFSDAVVAITPVLSVEPTDPEAAYLGSMSYAGEAGLRTLDLIANLATGLQSETLFQALAKSFPGSTTTQINEINTAATVLEAYGLHAANRTDAINFYALFMYYARIAVILNAFAYNSSNTLISNFSACYNSVSSTAAFTGIPDADIDTIAITIPRIIDTLTGIASSATSSISSLSSATTSITTITGALPFSETVTCASSPSSPQCLLVRTFINSASVGLDTLSDPEGGVCALLNPP